MEKDLWFSINQENEFLGVIKVIIRLVIFFWFYHSGHETAKKVFSAIEGIEYLKATVWILSLWSIRIQFYFFQIWKNPRSKYNFYQFYGPYGLDHMMDQKIETITIENISETDEIGQERLSIQQRNTKYNLYDS